VPSKLEIPITIEKAPLAEGGEALPERTAMNQSLVNTSRQLTEFTVQRDDGRDLSFVGEEIASVRSHPDSGHDDYSGSKGRWWVFALYRTRGGKFVCEQVLRSRWQDERAQYSGYICENVEQVIEFFGTSWLAKALYDSAGIEASIQVE